MTKFMAVTSLLDKFGINPENDMDEKAFKELVNRYNLIGFDYGDGELSASIAKYFSVDDKIKTYSLYFEEARYFRKPMTAFSYNSETKEVNRIFDTNRARGDQGNETRYYNFKKCPNTPECNSHYILDDGRVDPNKKTYKELMKIGFNFAINLIFKWNDMIEKDKPTIILVGRPSSSGWLANEKAYAEMLQESLVLPPDVNQNVKIAVHAESWAALAAYCNPQLGGESIKSDEVVVVIDNGSSTIDITVINRFGNQPKSGEDSYQFGGNNLDKNLMQALMNHINSAYKDAVLVTRHGHMLNLRVRKEMFYGINGTDRIKNIYNFDLNDKNNQKFMGDFCINDDLIDFAVNNTPSTVKHINNNGLGVTSTEVKSWIEGCRTIYQNFYNDMLPLFRTDGKDGIHSKIPDKVILSGGVSVMPEVRKVVEEVFGVTPVMAERPNESVSNGLAYIMACEMKKLQYLREVLEDIKKAISSSKQNIKESICRAGVEVEWEAFGSAFQEWVKSDNLVSIDDYLKLWHKKFDKNLEVRVQKGVEMWFNEEGKQLISELLQKKFDSMFPTFAGDFGYSMPTLNFEKLPGCIVQITNPCFLVFSHLTCKEEIGFFLSQNALTVKRDKRWREKAYETFLAYEEKIKKGGIITVEYRKKMLWFETRNSENISYKGIQEMYNTDLNDKYMLGIEKDIFNLMREPIKDYVEYITPYFNMSGNNSSVDCHE